MDTQPSPLSSSTIVILDFGSQYTQLIARRIREFNVFSVVLPCTTPLEKILALQPKGIVLSHWNLVSNVEATAQVYAVGLSDCMLGVLPLFHSFGLSYTLWFPLVHGFKTVFHPNPTDAKAIGELAGEHRPTLFLSTPTFCLSYLRKCTREQFASLRFLLVGAEKLRPALAQPQQIILGWSEPTSMALLARQLESRARADSSGTHLTRGHQNVRVMMSLIGLWTRLMDREVHRRVIPIGELV